MCTSTDSGGIYIDHRVEWLGSDKTIAAAAGSRASRQCCLNAAAWSSLVLLSSFVQLTQTRVVRFVVLHACVLWKLLQHCSVQGDQQGLLLPDDDADGGVQHCRFVTVP